jgi:hypothetical protein
MDTSHEYEVTEYSMISHDDGPWGLDRSLDIRTGLTANVDRMGKMGKRTDFLWEILLEDLQFEGR